MTTDLALEIHGQTLHLLPERALFWPQAHTLLIADPHFGKTSTFRAHAIPLPDGGTNAELQRLSQAINRTQATRLIILGDLLHAARGREESMFAVISHWRSHHPHLAIMLVRGNHDRHAGDPLPEWNFTVCDGPVLEAGWVFNHEPIASIEGYTLAGHLHPAVQLTGKGRQSLKLPCFWVRRQFTILPAFGEFIDHGLVRPQMGERVFVVTGTKVIAFSSAS